MENDNIIPNKRSVLHQKITEIVAKLPLDKTKADDSYDVISIAYELEKLFNENKEELLLNFSSYLESDWACPEIPTSVIEEYLSTPTSTT